MNEKELKKELKKEEHRKKELMMAFEELIQAQGEKGTSLATLYEVIFTTGLNCILLAKTSEIKRALWKCVKENFDRIIEEEIKKADQKDRP